MKTIIRLPLIMVWTVVLTAATAVLGAACLKGLRSYLGQGRYWFMACVLVGGALASGWPGVAVLLAAQLIVVGVFAELQEKDFSLPQAGAFSVLGTALLFASGFYLWTSIQHKSLLGILSGAIQMALTNAQTLNTELLAKIKVEDILFQVPSIAVVFLILSLVLSLIFEKQILYWLESHRRIRLRLADFAIADAVIWFFIFSLFGAFANHGVRSVEAVCVNILNVSVSLLFLQGAAVMGKYFTIFRTGFFWRTVMIVLLVVQVPLVLALVGLADYWVDFRKIFGKRAADLKKQVEE